MNEEKKEAGHRRDSENDGFPKETTFEEDMNQYWGDWGVSSEVDTLKAVLLRRPGKEVEHFDAAEYRFADVPVDVELMRRQHDAVARIYKEHGEKVYHVEEQREETGPTPYSAGI